VPDYIVINKLPQLNEGQPIALGSSVQMTAIVFYSDGHPRPESIHTFIWDIDNNTVASINQTGTVTAAKTFGEYTQTTISARLASMEEVTGVLKNFN
jgi:Bacterial Ig-like domain (group 2).